MKLFNLIIVLMIVGMTNCKNHDHNHNHDGHGHNHANQHMHNSNVADLIKSFDSDDRAATQKPYEVIALFGDLNGKKILDIGSGSGYFTFRLAEKGANVIAGDVNDEFLDHIDKKMKDNNLFSKRIETRKLPFDNPSLSNGEVDGAIIVNTYHHIDDRVAYFSKVSDGLTRDGMLMVVDFMKKKFDNKIQGPPYKMRIASTVVIEELKKAGFDRIEVNADLLPHQYIVMAWKE